MTQKQIDWFVNKAWTGEGYKLKIPVAKLSQIYFKHSWQLYE